MPDEGFTVPNDSFGNFKTMVGDSTGIYLIKYKSQSPCFYIKVDFDRSVLWAKLAYNVSYCILPVIHGDHLYF